MSTITRSYTNLRAAWYAEAALQTRQGVSDELTIQVHEDDVCIGEFTIAWTVVGHGIAPNLSAFADAWLVLPLCVDLIRQLAKLNDDAPSIDDVIGILQRLGYEDHTVCLTPNA